MLTNTFTSTAVVHIFQVIEQNLTLKLQSPDYINVDPGMARRDFRVFACAEELGLAGGRVAGISYQGLKKLVFIGP